MLRGLINNVPIWLLLIVVVAAIAGVVVALVWLIRRRVPPVREGFDAEVSSQLLGVVAALFGLLLAFIVVIAYQNYGDTQSNVSNEADALAAIVRDSDAFPQPDGARVRTAVGVYVRAVVTDEWPRMHQGKDSARAAAAVAGMYRAIQGVDPKSARATAFYDDAVQQLSSVLAGRRDRLDNARGGLPWVIGVLLLVGSIIIVGYTVLVGSRSFWFHAIGSGAVAIVLGLSLVVLLDLTYPFSGDLSVGTAPFRNGVLAQFFAPSG
ncbi:MAG TPA: DUF4239 domain-containing protein [Gaiellaceae bacterium]|nr:DUF4239 domain-containing protein [Gaiellaceae bacterium]